MGHFIYKESLYPTNKYTIIVSGDLVGVQEIGNGQWVQKPSHYFTHWAEASVQDVIDTISASIYAESGLVLDPDRSSSGIEESDSKAVFIGKPFTQQGLADKIREALRDS